MRLRDREQSKEGQTGQFRIVKTFKTEWLVADKQPLRVIFRDSCFEQDADKINIYETFKQLLDWSDKDVEKNIRVI